MVIVFLIVAGIIAFFLLYRLGAVRPPSVRGAGGRRRGRSKTPWRDAMAELEGSPYKLEGNSSVVIDGKKPEAFQAHVEGVKVLVMRTGSRVVIEASSSHPERLQLGVEGRDDLVFRDDAQESRLLTGHGAFDRHFDLTTNNLDLSLLWLTRYVRQRLLVAMSFGVKLEPGKITAERRADDPFNPEEIVEAAKAVARLTDQGRTMTGRWREIAQAVGGSLASPESAWKLGSSSTISVEDRGTSVQISVTRSSEEDESRGECLRTIVSATLLHSDDERFVLYRDVAPRGTRRLMRVRDFDDELGEELELRANKAAKKLKRLNARRCRVLRELSPLQLVGDGDRVVLDLQGLVLDHARLLLAVETVGDLAAPVSAGPYR